MQRDYRASSEIVQRGRSGVKRLSTSQALSSVVEVAQGFFLPTLFAFGLGLEEWSLIARDGTRRLDFALAFIEARNAPRGRRFEGQLRSDILCKVRRRLESIGE
jgi:hypothetical protein